MFFGKNILKIGQLHCKLPSICNSMIKNTLYSVTIRSKSDFHGLSPIFYNHIPLSLDPLLRMWLARGSTSLTNLESVRSNWTSWTSSTLVLMASRFLCLYVANSFCSTHLFLLQPCLET